MKIYLDYRELMTTGCWQQRDDSKKITKAKFLNSQNFCTNFLNSQNSWNLPKLSLGCWTLADFCLMKKVEAPFIGERTDMKLSFNVENFLFLHMGGQLEPWWIISAEGKKSLLLTFFPQAPRCLLSELVDKVYCSLLFTFWLIGLLKYFM